MKKVNISNYRKDTLYSSVARAVSEILQSGDVVTPVDVLLRLKRVTKQQVEDWRFGRIAYLERVCNGNLAKLNRMLRILDLHCRAMGRKPSQTVYRKWGKGGKKIVLRFSKSGPPNLETAYSRHYVRQRAKSKRPDGDGRNAEIVRANVKSNRWATPTEEMSHAKASSRKEATE